MRLWSWQAPDFSLTDGYVNSPEGEYWEDVPTIRPAYEALWKHLGTRDIIWCYTSRSSYYLRPNRTMVGWVIDAPDAGILRFVDDQKWDDYVHGRRDPQEPAFSAIFIYAPSTEHDCALLRHPIPESWVVDCQSYVGEGKRVLPPE